MRATIVAANRSVRQLTRRLGKSICDNKKREEGREARAFSVERLTGDPTPLYASLRGGTRRAASERAERAA